MTLLDLFTEENIIFQISRIRAKLSKQRSKLHIVHQLADDKKYNYHINHEKNIDKVDEEQKLLNDITPSRRKWINLTKKERYKNGQRLNNIDINTQSLVKTINYYRKKKPSEGFVIKLNKFLAEVINSVTNNDYKIDTPKIIPELKGKKQKKENKCRPISSFKLKDRIIISLTNKYFTTQLDYQFYEHSYAFRATQIVDKNKVQLTHHNAIESIQEYKKNYKGKRLWISECDISKFFDSVSHKVIKSILKKAVTQYQKEKGEKFDKNAIRIFNAYLKCYSFNENVLIYNTKAREDYWLKYDIPNGLFGWVEDELKTLKFYSVLKKNRIGVPQGGAISGLVANLLLNEADKMFKSFKDEKLHYVRFCDDMVLIHPIKRKCKYYSDLYQEKLKQLKLIPHPYKKLDYADKKSFWDDKIKSKSPYKWSNEKSSSFHWFGFVGYEISYNNEIRVRKKSLKKEKTKQKDLINLTLNSLSKGKRKSDETIIESVNNRLVGMSVGRINIRNYHSVIPDLCWTNGFKKLEDNNTLKLQLKQLDQYRGAQVNRLKKGLKKLPAKIKEPQIKIPLLLFTRIAGIKKNDSINIVNNLIKLGVLNNKRILTTENRKLISAENYELGLDSPYDKINDTVIQILISFGKDNREPVYYGKPFSYYYHVIEKGKTS